MRASGQRLSAWLLVCCAVAVDASGLAQLSVQDRIEALDRFVEDHKHAREYVDSRWDELPEIAWPCTTASTVGHLGAKSTYSKSTQHMILDADYEQFKRLNLPIYTTACNAWVSHKYKFIYVRMLKSASSTVLTTFFAHICSNAAEVGVARCSREELVQIKDELEFVNATEIDEWWKEYFVFSFIRNPWARLSSGYFMFTARDLMRRRLEDGTAGEICGSELPFADVAKRAGTIGEMCKKLQCCTYEDKDGWKLKTAYYHVHDQSHCLFDINGRVMTDFIGTAETFEQDFRTVIAEINRRSQSNIKIPEVKAKNMAMSSDGQYVDPNKRVRECSMEQYPHMDEQIMRDIAVQYALDALRFGYIDGYVPHFQSRAGLD